MNPPPQKPSRRWANGVVIGLFLGVLALPTVDYFTGVDVTRPPGENRLPARWPQLAQWNFSGAQKFIAGAETYYNDHFGFRKRLVRWNQQWRQRLYRDESGFKVVLGREGWMFSGELQMIEHYLGMARFTPAQLQTWQKLLEKRRDWLAARGIQYLFIVAPDKHDIYPEMLPGWLQAAAPAGRETKLDQFLSYMNAHSTVPVLDLRPPLVAAKKIAPTYLQNDTHWNSFGGFVAGQEVVKFLGEKIPGLPPLRLEDFTWTNAPFTGGDIARQAGREPAEKNYFVFSPKPGVASPKLHTDTSIVSTWGPRNEAVISEGAAPLTVGAVIFHDSFAAPWLQFFGHSFQRVVFLNEKREFNTQFITDSHPQVVITEMLERFFNTYEPAEFLAREALP